MLIETVPVALAMLTVIIASWPSLTSGASIIIVEFLLVTVKETAFEAGK